MLLQTAPLRERFPVEEIAVTEPSEGGSAGWSGRQGSWWQRKKRPQLECMLGQVGAVLRAHPEWGVRPLRIVDVGGGKGSLAQAIGNEFGENVAVTVLDIQREAVAKGAHRIKQRGMPNLEFVHGDASRTRFEHGLDVVVALHAWLVNVQTAVAS